MKAKAKVFVLNLRDLGVLQRLRAAWLIVFAGRFEVTNVDVSADETP